MIIFFVHPPVTVTADIRIRFSCYVTEARITASAVSLLAFLRLVHPQPPACFSCGVLVRKPTLAFRPPNQSWIWPASLLTSHWLSLQFDRTKQQQLLCPYPTIAIAVFDWLDSAIAAAVIASVTCDIKVAARPPRPGHVAGCSVVILKIGLTEASVCSLVHVCACLSLWVGAVLASSEALLATSISPQHSLDNASLDGFASPWHWCVYCRFSLCSGLAAFLPSLLSFSLSSAFFFVPCSRVPAGHQNRIQPWGHFNRRPTVVRLTPMGAVEVLDWIESVHAGGGVHGGVQHGSNDSENVWKIANDG